MIVSRQNRTLKDIRRLRRSKGEHALLEGTHLVAAALAAGVRLETVLASPDFLDSIAGRDLAAEMAIPPLAVEPGLLADLADADSPRGLLAVAHLPRAGVEGLPALAGGIYLYLDGLQDPGNLGALARVAEAAGAVGMALSASTVYPNHPRAMRASAGSLLRLPVATGVDAEELDRHLCPPEPSGPSGARGPRAPGALPPRWVALVPRGGVALYDLPAAGLHGTLVLALGAEGPGVSPELLARAGLRITIPVAPPVESLNATVAAALTLFELRRRRAEQQPHSPEGPTLRPPDRR